MGVLISVVEKVLAQSFDAHASNKKDELLAASLALFDHVWEGKHGFAVIDGRWVFLPLDFYVDNTDLVDKLYEFGFTVRYLKPEQQKNYERDESLYKLLSLVYTERRDKEFLTDLKSWKLIETMMGLSLWKELVPRKITAFDFGFTIKELSELERKHEFKLPKQIFRYLAGRGVVFEHERGAPIRVKRPLQEMFSAYARREDVFMWFNPLNPTNYERHHTHRLVETANELSEKYEELDDQQFRERLFLTIVEDIKRGKYADLR